MGRSEWLGREFDWCDDIGMTRKSMVSSGVWWSVGTEAVKERTHGHLKIGDSPMTACLDGAHWVT